MAKRTIAMPKHRRTVEIKTEIPDDVYNEALLQGITWVGAERRRKAALKGWRTRRKHR